MWCRDTAYIQEAQQRRTDAKFFDRDGGKVLCAGNAGRFTFANAIINSPWTGTDATHVNGYQDDSTYSMSLTGQGDKLSAVFRDSPLTDNSCSMTLEFYAPLEVDLQIYKPGVIDSTEPMIPDGDELAVGSATFVNLDNDDQDAHYDDTDDEVRGGDDELVHIKLRVQAEIDDSYVTLAAQTGANDIRIWSQNDKLAASAYQIGNIIPYSDFTKTSEWLERDLWIEGIGAQTTQRATQLRLQQGFGGEVASDDVALTVIGVGEVKWLGYGNAVDASDNLDPDPNWPTGLLPSDPNNPTGPSRGATRVFPDKRLFTNGSSQIQDANPWTEVRVRTTLSVAPPIDSHVYIRAFDVDDPTAHTGDVDDESGEFDNRGAVETFGWQASGVTPNRDATRELSFAAGEIDKEASYIISTQPGDNFRVVANADNDFLLRLKNDDNKLDVGGETAIEVRNANKQRNVNEDIPFTISPSDSEVRNPYHYASGILTVWRFLHVERDSMANPPSWANTVAGEVFGITGTGAALTGVSTNTAFDDGSWNLDTPVPPPGSPPGTPTTRNGRFENGTLVLGVGAGAVTISPITGNGYSRLAFPATSIAGLPFSAADTDLWTDFNSGTITNVAVSGLNYVWTVSTTTEGETSWNEFIGGGLSISGGRSMNIVGADRAAGTLTTDRMRIPFSLADDDTVTALTLPDTTQMVSKFQSAYVLPVMDGGGNINNDKATVQFETSVDTTSHAALDAQFDKAGAFESEAWRDQHYWIAYVFAGYEPNPASDSDADDEKATLGITGGREGSLISVRGSMVFLETSEDFGRIEGWTAAERSRINQLVVVHEIGHQFNLYDETGPMGNNLYQYADVLNASVDPVFQPLHLNLIRSARNPGVQ